MKRIRITLKNTVTRSEETLAFRLIRLASDEKEKHIALEQGRNMVTIPVSQIKTIVSELLKLDA